MRKLMSMITLLVIAALGWGAYWYVGAQALETELGDWLEERRAGGWVAEAATLETRGFPNRFDTTFEDLSLADPDTLVAWSAPVFQLLQLSYKPNHVIAVWPGRHRLSVPTQEIDISSERMIGSFEVEPHPELPLRALTVEASGARFVSTRGWEVALGSGQVSMRQTPGEAQTNSYDIYVDGTDLTPSSELLANLGSTVDLPDTIGGLRVSATIRFDKPWDKSAIEEARPQPRRIALDTAAATWGTLGLTATGTLDIGADGTPSGTLDLSATNWRGIVAVIEASGKVDPDYLRALAKGLELVAGLKGDPETLDVALKFKRGWMNIGPIPVAPAPKLALP